MEEVVALGPGDEIFVADACNHRVQVFAPDGSLRRVLGGPGTEPGQLRYPYGIAVDARGGVFVVDSGNTRVQQFIPSEEGSERLQEEAETATVLTKEAEPK